LSVEAESAPRRHWIVWALGSWLAALVLTLTGFVLTYHTGPWLPEAQERSIPGAQLKVRDKSRVEGSGVVLQGVGEDGNAVAIVNLDPPVEAANFRFVEVRARGEFPSGGMHFVWRVRGAETTVRKTEVLVSGSRIVPLTLGAVDGWTGSVVGLGLIARGDLSKPFLVERIDLRPSWVGTTIGGMLAHWLEFEPWDGGSIHFMSGGNPSLKYPLPVFLGIAFAVAVGIYLLLIVLGHTRFEPRAALVIAVLGWAVIDARWQLNLWRQLDLTRFQYAGRSWEEKRLAAEDGQLFAFMQEVKAKIGDAPARVFVFSDEEYDRMRGAYHLYPANVSAQAKRQALLPARMYRPGDVLVLYRKRGVEFNAAEKRLRWEGKESVAADLVFLSKGSAVFRVLGAS
jgi:hypothetical protein